MYSLQFERQLEGVRTIRFYAIPTPGMWERDSSLPTILISETRHDRLQSRTLLRVFLSLSSLISEMFFKSPVTDSMHSNVPVQMTKTQVILRIEVIKCNNYAVAFLIGTYLFGKKFSLFLPL